METLCNEFPNVNILVIIEFCLRGRANKNITLNLEVTFSSTRRETTQVSRSMTRAPQKSNIFLQEKATSQKIFLR